MASSKAISLTVLFLLSLGLVCASGSRKLSAGDRCNPDSSSECSSGLICENEKCKIKRLGVCTNTPSECSSGLACVGSGAVKKCNMLMGPGGKCETDPFWFCKGGLLCESNVCKVADRGVCTETPMECAEGLTCVGGKDLKKCKVLRKVDETCGQDPFWVCEEGLVCQNRCKIGSGVVCTKSPGSCANGLQCIGEGAQKKCLTPVPAGGECGAGGSAGCEAGLSCEEGKCKIPKGKSCAGAPAGSCVSGTTCGKNKRCQNPAPTPVPVGGGVRYVCGWKLRSWTGLPEERVQDQGKWGLYEKSQPVCRWPVMHWNRSHQTVQDIDGARAEV